MPRKRKKPGWFKRLTGAAMGGGSGATVGTGIGKFLFALDPTGTTSIVVVAGCATVGAVAGAFGMQIFGPGKDDDDA